MATLSNFFHPRDAAAWQPWEFIHGYQHPEREFTEEDIKEEKEAWKQVAEAMGKVVTTDG